MALGPSDIETIADDLDFIMASVAASESRHADLREAFGALRVADSYATKATALTDLRTRLSESGVNPTPALLLALNTRILAAGTNERTDRFIGQTIAAWDAAERRLGIDVDARVFALAHSGDTALEGALGVVPESRTEETRSSWRYGVLYGMLWPRGAELRSQTMRANNPFMRSIECDRLLVLVAVPPVMRSVPLSNASWHEIVSQVLAQDGVVELVALVGDARQLANALRRISAEPIDTGGILVHARLSAIRRDASDWRAVLELPEAFQ
jgi:hypothetical protein